MWKCGKCQVKDGFIILERPRGFARCGNCGALFFIKPDGSLAYCQGGDNDKPNMAVAV